MSDRDRYPYERSRRREQVMGCWLGKAIGGTLGQSFEGLDGPLDVSFHQPVPDTMVPNDDLDLQVVWACHLAAMDRPVVDRHTLAQAWLRQRRPPTGRTGEWVVGVADAHSKEWIPNALRPSNP